MIITFGTVTPGTHSLLINRHCCFSPLPFGTIFGECIDPRTRMHRVTRVARAYLLLAECRVIESPARLSGARISAAILPLRDYRGGLLPFFLGRKSRQREERGTLNGTFILPTAGETSPRSLPPPFRARKRTRSPPSSHPVPFDHPCGVHRLSPRGSDSNAARRDFLARPRASARAGEFLSVHFLAVERANFHSARRNGTAYLHDIMHAAETKYSARVRAREAELSFLRGRGGSRRAGLGAEAQSDIAVVGSCTPPGSVNLN